MIYLCEEELRTKIDSHINKFDYKNDVHYSYYVILDFSHNYDETYNFFVINYKNNYDENDPLNTFYKNIRFTSKKYKQLELNNRDQGYKVCDEYLSEFDNKYADIISMGY